MKTPVQQKASTLAQILANVRLVYRLLKSNKVALWVKVVPILALIYVISPVDFIPDPILGLGQLDDLTVLLLGMWTFLQLCPPDVVAEMRGESNVVDGSFRVVPDDTAPATPDVEQLAASDGAKEPPARD
jgi:uncharacterized membrane protein YkvA (DUF1232 family)